MTGHEDGIVTINLAESDDPHREQVRADMGEPYRTMLGHLRHETGHYYWPVLSPGSTSPAVQRPPEVTRPGCNRAQPLGYDL